jgi:glycosyltransferase involved in cell wall biosynthesis
MPKIAVVSIMKNESLHIARWAESCKDADYRILLDTGSTDDSVAIAEACGVTVYHQTFNPWRFDVARNHLLDLIPEDTDWIFNLDVDEVFGDGWRAALEKMPNDGSVNRHVTNIAGTGSLLFMTLKGKWITKKQLNMANLDSNTTGINAHDVLLTDGKVHATK